MKKTDMTGWTRAALLFLAALLLCAALLPHAAAETAADYTVEILRKTPEAVFRNAGHDSSWYSESAVYERMMAMKAEYPEGMHWTNDNSYGHTYEWHGGKWDGYNLHYTGYGCVGFALILSDAAFGTDMPIWQKYFNTGEVSFDDIRVGDILRINNDSHSVIVLQVSSSSVTIAEGNYNSSIHWGRTLSRSAVEKADYVLSRWPGVPNTFTVSYDANGGTGAPDPQGKILDEDLVLSSVRPARDGYFFLGWAESATAAVPVYQPGGIFALNADTTLYAVWTATDFVLPSSLTEIREEAFAGGAFRFAKLSEKTVSVGKNAFANCKNLKYVYIPASAASIHADAFNGVTGLTVLGPAGSAAEDYALEHGFAFIAVP